MCGKYGFEWRIIEKDGELHSRLVHVGNTRSVYFVDYNIAPTGKGIIIPRDWKPREAFWGLLPKWAPDRKFAQKTFNAKAETIDEKPTFRDAFYERRCLVPAVGWYEWAGKQPYFVRPEQEDKVLLLAGLWDYWEREKLLTYTIITKDAEDYLSALHPRMPVVLKNEQLDLWMSDSKSVEKSVLTQHTNVNVKYHKVSHAVNDKGRHSEDLIEPLEENLLF